MTAFGLAARWTHLVCGLGLVGIFSVWLLAGRSDRPTAGDWASRTLSLARWLAVGAIFSGFATLAHQLIVVAGRADALLDPAMWLRLLMHSQFGVVWLVRHGLLVLCAALVLFREHEESAIDWTVWRIEAWALAAAAVAAMAWAGHAVAVEPRGPVAVARGRGPPGRGGPLARRALPPRSPPACRLERGRGRRAALCCPGRASILQRRPRRDAADRGHRRLEHVGRGGRRPRARRHGLRPTAPRQDRAASAAFWASPPSTGGVLPALSGEGATVGRPAMARLSRLVACELALGLLMVTVAAALSLTVPADPRHACGGPSRIASPTTPWRNCLERTRAS